MRHYQKLGLLVLSCAVFIMATVSVFASPNVVVYEDFSGYNTEGELERMWFPFQNKGPLQLIEDSSCTGGKGVGVRLGEKAKMGCGWYPFEPMTKGSVEIRFYDPNNPYEQGSSGVAGITDELAKFWLFVGVGTSNFGQPRFPNNYAFRLYGGNPGWTLTNVKRTEGWHVLKFAFDHYKITAFIDDVVVFETEAAPFNKVGGVAIGSLWPVYDDQLIFDTVTVME